MSILNETQKKAVISTIRRAINAAGGSQEAFAAEVGISASRLAQILRGNFVRLDGQPARAFNHAKTRLASPKATALGSLEAQLQKAVIRAWDKTERGARRILDVLKAFERH